MLLAHVWAPARPRPHARARNLVIFLLKHLKHLNTAMIWKGNNRVKGV